MHVIRQVVSRASRRFFVNDLFHALAITLSIGVGLLILARIAEQVLGLKTTIGPHWGWIFAGVSGTAVLASLVWALVTRRTPLSIAQAVDERASLRESLSTALYIERDNARGTSQDPTYQAWSANMLQTAAATAATVRVNQAVPYEAPRAWPAPVLAGMALGVIWYAVPHVDLLGKDTKRVAERQAQQELVEVKAQVRQDREKLRELLAKTKVEMLDEPTADELRPEQPQLQNDPDAIRRSAIKELTDVQSALEKARNSEQSMQTEALQRAMEQLRQPGPGPLEELSRALQKGDFGAARAALEQVQRQVQDGAMSPEQRAQAAKQAEGLAKQLDKLAQDQSELVRKLQDKGLDRKSAEELAKKAGDPAQLAQELSKLPGMNSQMQNELMKMAQAQQEAQGQCQNMSQSMGEMAQGLQQEGMSQQGAQAMEQMGQQLSEAEQMASDMENMEAALEETKDQLAQLGRDMKKEGKRGQGQRGQGQGQGEGEGEGQGQGQGEGEGQGEGAGEGEGQGQGQGEGQGQGGLGQWQAGTSSNRGSGSGGPGQGSGAGPESAPADFELEKKKAPVPQRPGQIIGSRLVFGEQVKGEAVADFQEAVVRSQETLAEGISGMRVPRELEGAVKNYFGRLERKARESQRPAAAPAGSGEKKQGDK